MAIDNMASYCHLILDDLDTKSNLIGMIMITSFDNLVIEKYDWEFKQEKSIICIGKCEYPFVH